MVTTSFLVGTLLFSSISLADSLKDIKHVVLFMQENRAFDHYFGTMPGVRGFADPNVQVNPDGRTTFQQLVTKKQTSAATQLTPWYLNYLGGTWNKATQCMGAGDNSWQAMHAAYNGGLTNQWASTNTPYSIGYFKRDDIPIHFDIADGWTVADMYQEGILAATDPNRIIWMSGTVNNTGTPNNPAGDGGMILDNNASPGCEKPRLNCFPFTWKTLPEYWEDSGVSWQVYQDPDNFEDNMLAYFDQYQKANKTSPLTTKGNTYLGLQKFYDDAASDNLPQISYIIGPAELSEHQPYLPSDGAWLQKQVVDAVVNGPAYNNTVLMISYDEVGGYGDHVTPFHAPKDTPGEWITDPYGNAGDTPVGPGFRVPFSIISPWTRGGYVFTEHADHNSQVLFVENWLTAIGVKDIKSEEMPPWRRQYMSNLLNAFDFDHPDYSIPTITESTAPLIDTTKKPPVDGPLGALTGNYIGAAKCQATYKTSQPPVPYGPSNANANVSLLTEEGFKPVRGMLTEGRYLTFEMSGYALTNTGRTAFHVIATKASPNHESINHRWVIHQVGDETGNSFVISSAVDGRYVSYGQVLSSSRDLAEVYMIADMGSGKGYSLMPSSGNGGSNGNGLKLSSGNGALFLTLSTYTGTVFPTVAASGFSVFSVTYHS